MMETGIPKLDERLGGGIPAGKTLLCYVQPGVEGEVFGMQTLYHNLKLGKKAVYVTSTSDPKIIREYFKEFGWDTEEFKDNFAMVDAYSGMLGIESQEKYFVKDPDSIDNLNDVITRAIEDISGGMVIFGSLSTIIDMAEGETALKYIKNWNKHIMLYDGVGIYAFTAWPYPDEMLRKMEEDLFNATIKVSGVSEKVVYGQYYAVSRADWGGDVKEKAVMFRVYRPGGIKAFIPKVLVTGPFNSGKSTFVHALATRAVSVDRLATTVALDYGHIDHKGFAVDIFGTPGQERFAPVIKQLRGQAMGIFLIVNSTRPEEFPRAKEMLEETRTTGLPYIIIANQQDREGALSPDEIRKRMNLSETVPVIPTVATEKEGVFKAFEILVDMITR
jgi:small GTP-binding protein